MLAVEQAFAEISSMKPLDKLQLIEKILGSLNQPNKKIEDIWVKEVEERLEAYEKGNITVVSEEDVFQKYRRS
jgi:putative addiction module component (TIGR02574 family)